MLYHAPISHQNHVIHMDSLGAVCIIPSIMMIMIHSSIIQIDILFLVLWFWVLSLILVLIFVLILVISLAIVWLRLVVSILGIYFQLTQVRSDLRNHFLQCLHLCVNVWDLSNRGWIFHLVCYYSIGGVMMLRHPMGLIIEMDLRSSSVGIGKI